MDHSCAIVGEAHVVTGPFLEPVSGQELGRTFGPREQEAVRPGLASVGRAAIPNMAFLVFPLHPGDVNTAATCSNSRETAILSFRPTGQDDRFRPRLVILS